MEVITTHTNADFDTYASMVAAKKLYPQACLVFSGSVEKRLRETLPGLPLFNEVLRLKDIDISKITRLILVDARQPSRIGPFSEIASRPGLDIHIYDHHPSTSNDIRGSVEEIRPYGSTTTVLARIIRAQGIKLTPEEATLLMAGIYEDTGSLSYPSTCAEDYDAAAYLLKCGADLSVVSGLLRRELTAYEVSLLDELLKSETIYTFDGLEIMLAEASSAEYSGDISVLAHKLRDIEGAKCLFVLVDTGDRIHVIARSSAAEADVGVILKALGGGGHRSAASATVKGATLTEAKELLLGAIRKNITPSQKAGDIMSFPAITALVDMPLNDAFTLMRRYNINAAPVVRDMALLGVITRQVVDKAVFHGLGAAEVGDYMTTGCDFVHADTSVTEIREKVISHGQRLLPVLKDGLVAGVITRTDLLKLLQEELRERPGAGTEKKLKVVANLLSERMPGWLLERLKDMGASAEGMGCRVYAVGGFVRDLFLRRENLDVDIVIEGRDAIEFAFAFAKDRGLRVRPHERFRTAVIIFPDGFKIDAATARLEYYERPGALPIVERSSLKLDLYRRDFIINTLAIALNPSRFGELVDFFGALRDIKEKTIRALHNLSFIEDPTRALRAVRFSEKFAFKIERHTLNLIKNAVKLDVLKDFSGPRILVELKNILAEEGAVKTVVRLNELGLLGLIHRSIKLDSGHGFFIEAAREAAVWHRLLYTGEKVEEWLVLFLALTDRLNEEELKHLAKRLGISGKKRQSVISSRSDGLRALRAIEQGLVRKNSEIYGLLKPLPIEAVIYLMAKAGHEEAKMALSAYITRLRNTRLELSGKDLISLGIPQGERMGEVLRLLLEKRLDSEIKTREGELEVAKAYLKKAGD